MGRLSIAALLAAWTTFAAAQYGPEMPVDTNRNYTALWWNSAESGWGLNTTHQGGILFATLFTYAPDGQPMWLVASRLAETPGYPYTYSGPLYRASGPPFFQQPWSPVALTQVGTMDIEFVTPTVGVLTYSFNGVAVTKAIEQQQFGTRVASCRAVSGSRAAADNYQDLWWNPAESGWGMNLVHQDDILFATLFTYSEAGRDRWFVASGLRRQADGSFSGALYSTTGPAFDASPWAPIGLAEVGTMTLAFADGEHGTLSYTVLGRTVTKSIERQVFAATAPVCR